MNTQLCLIYAHDRHGGIGLQGGLPWHLPEDLAYFKTNTLHQTVIMGRKTWDALPDKVRPLPKRNNIVLSRNVGCHAQGAAVFSSLEQALSACPTTQQPVWIIGGASVYRAALPLAQRVLATEIDASFAADAFAPELDAQWQASLTPWRISQSGLRYRFVTWQRKALNITA